jgi:uncharacterized protein YjiK
MTRERTSRAWVGAFGLVVLAQAEAWLPRYDLREDRAEVHRLARPLAEVSGLAFDDRGRLFAHNDELALLYELDPASGAIVRTITLGAPGTRGDFEGVAIAGRRFFMMTAGGTLLVFAEPEGNAAASIRQVDTGLNERCELEGLAYDPAKDALLVPCKAPRARTRDDRIVVFEIPLRTLRPAPQPRLSVPYSRLAAVGLGPAFHPSSIEVHPRSGSLFLLSGQHQALVEIAPDGSILAGRRLPRRLHPQPEGLTFGPDLALWIGDEGGNGRGALTRYRLTAAGSR